MGKYWSGTAILFNDMSPSFLKSFKTRSQMTLDIPLSKRNIIQRGISQLTFTCSKSAIETLEKGLKYVQSLQQKH